MYLGNIEFGSFYQTGLEPQQPISRNFTRSRSDMQSDWQQGASRRVQAMELSGAVHFGCDRALHRCFLLQLFFFELSPDAEAPLNSLERKGCAQVFSGLRLALCTDGFGASLGETQWERILNDINVVVLKV